MRKWLLGMAAVVLAAGAAVAAPAGLTVEKAWVRAAPPGARALAGYMVLKNDSSRPVVLVGAKCDRFARVMLHRTIMVNGMMKMVHQASITVPAHGELAFHPDGYHVMLMGPKSPVKAGQTLRITLEFRGGDSLVVTYPVKPGMGGGMKMGHGGM